MRERPILFSAPMVRAILDGRKTQTRRVVKVPVRGGADFEVEDGWPVAECTDGESRRVACPYGQPGDRLWVRETWRQAYPKTEFSDGIIYRADKSRALGMNEYSDLFKWRPSIFMSRSASRITLEVTGVRVERLQAISEADAIAEGVERPSSGIAICDAKTWYRVLWDQINGADAWAANPWVWVVEFRRVPQ